MRDADRTVAPIANPMRGASIGSCESQRSGAYVLVCTLTDSTQSAAANQSLQGRREFEHEHQCLSKKFPLLRLLCYHGDELIQCTGKEDASRLCASATVLLVTPGLTLPTKALRSVSTKERQLAGGALGDEGRMSVAPVGERMLAAGPSPRIHLSHDGRPSPSTIPSLFGLNTSGSCVPGCRHACRPEYRSCPRELGLMEARRSW